jgi:hypothetical protein
MARAVKVVFERGPLGSHVAVQDGPPLALPAHCTAGDEGRHRERHHREQEPAHLCRVCQTGWLGASRGCCHVALSIYAAAMVLVDGFTMVLVVATPLHLTGLPIQKPLCQPVPSRVQWETRRWHSMRGLQWMVYIISRYDR